MQTVTAPAVHTVHSPHPGGRPPHDSPALRQRNRDWRDMHDQLGWSPERIARHVGKKPRTVREGIAAARLYPATVAEVLGPEDLTYIESHPRYASDPAVREWLQRQAYTRDRR